ncbi:MAG: hypothetical protein Q7R34_05300 [Dehalococcoidia bacterium]|nr:hypothetical protein [Dehalococcoidia bacterium]
MRIMFMIVVFFARAAMTFYSSACAPQGHSGHNGNTPDASTSTLAIDSHPPSASTEVNHDSSTSIPNEGDQPHLAPAGASVGSPNYTLLVSVLAVVAVTFGTVFYLKRKEAPDLSANQTPVVTRKLRQ